MQERHDVRNLVSGLGRNHDKRRLVEGSNLPRQSPQAPVFRLRNQVENGTLDLPAPSALERPIFEGTGDPPEEHDLDATDVASLSDDELRATILELEREEDDISLHRRVLHGRIDILRAERERRRRGGLHVEPTDLGPILGGSSR